MHTDNEIRILTQLNIIYGLGFQLAKGQYSSYDGISENYIAEIKVRDKHYSDKLIEVSKFKRCKQIASRMGKQFLYIVEDPKGCYVYNLSKLHSSLLDSKVYNCPRTTAFESNDYIPKKLLLLKEIYSKKVW